MQLNIAVERDPYPQLEGWAGNRSNRGRHVGVIATGSSGVQVIPRIAQEAASVTVFHGTAAYNAESA